MSDVASFVIQKGVPIPPRERGDGPGRGRPKGAFTLTLFAMDIGDSIYVEGKSRPSLNRAVVDASRDGFRYVTRKQGQGFRVWRVS